MVALDEPDEGSGGGQLAEKRALYARLIARGVSNSEACRLVGINRKTGTRWRYGRTIRNSGGEAVHYPPVTAISDVQPVSARFLSLNERTTIADLHHGGESVRAIARELGRPPSTVSRELRRNRDDHGRYRPHAAHEQARTRRARPRPRRVATDPVLRAMVEDLLGVKWSPEQIAHELSVRFGHDRSRRLCAESIYQAIYDPNTPLQRPARTALRTRRRRRRPHPTGTQRRGRLRDMTMIEQRPAEVADRAVAGHWEGDLIMGAGNRSAIATLVERASRYVVLVHLPDGHTANWVRDGVVAAFTALPVSLRRTLTWDQGKEMAQHLEITAATGMPVYFCQAHSPWQRGSNENMNGLLRQYFPKGSDLSRHTAEDLATAQMQLNTRPRKTLQWATPDALVGALLSTPSADDRCDDP